MARASATSSNLDFRLLLAAILFPLSVSPLHSPSLSLSLSLFVLPQQFSSSFSASPDDAHCARIARARAGAGEGEEEGKEQIRPPCEKLQLKLPGIYSTLSAAADRDRVPAAVPAAAPGPPLALVSLI